MVKKALVVGKGPTAKLIRREDFPEVDVFVGINQAVQFIDYPDVLVMNDMEGADDIPDETMKHLKIIVIPFYPHHKEHSQFTHTWRDVKSRLKSFTGEFFIHYLFTTPPPLRLEPFPILHPSPLNSASIAIAYLNSIDVKTIDFYGIALSGGYSSLLPKFSKYKLHLKKNPLLYNPQRQTQLMNQLCAFAKHKNITIKFS